MQVLAEYSTFLDTLAGFVGRENLLLSSEDLAPYLEDWRGRYRGHALAVLRPGSSAEVAAVLRACAEAGVSIVPQGGNTGLCGGATPLAEGVSIVLSLERMNRIRALDADNNTLLVEAGCTLAAVQQAAAAAGRLFPLALASEGSCTIGGNLSTNAGGIQVLRYGNMRDLVLGLEVVLPDGRCWDGLRSLRKDNTGYDLKHLFIGAEGSLGVITAAVLKLFPAIRQQATAWVAVSGVEAALALFRHIGMHCGAALSAFELIGRSGLDLVLRHFPDSRDPLPASAGDWVVLLELSDSRADADLQTVLESVLGEALAAGWVDDAVLASSGAQRQALWALRENLSEAQKLEGLSLKHDISLPRSQIPQFLSETEASLHRWWQEQWSAHWAEPLPELAPSLRLVVFGHLGDGNLHYNLSLAGPENAVLMAQGDALSRVVHDQVAACGGSISAEHGIGQLKREALRRYKSPLELELMQRIKSALDPQGRMNPGKVLPD